MIQQIRQAYRRGFNLAFTRPLLLIPPFAAELLQHTAEIQLGMYSHNLNGHAQAIRFGFGAIKVLMLLLTLLIALRWWRFEGDPARALRPGKRMFLGLGTVILVQIGGDLLMMTFGYVLMALLGSEASQGQRFVALLIPLFIWLFAAGLLFPWYVGLLTEDRMMTLRRSVATMRGHLIEAFASLIAGCLPLMAMHYTLGFGAMGRSGFALWMIMVVDGLLVALLIMMLAATYFEIYEGATSRRERV